MKERAAYQLAPNLVVLYPLSGRQYQVDCVLGLFALLSPRFIADAGWLGRLGNRRRPRHSRRAIRQRLLKPRRVLLSLNKPTFTSFAKSKHQTYPVSSASRFTNQHRVVIFEQRKRDARHALRHGSGSLKNNTLCPQRSRLKPLVVMAVFAHGSNKLKVRTLKRHHESIKEPSE